MFRCMTFTILKSIMSKEKMRFEPVSCIYGLIPFSLGDYLIYNKEKNCYYNLSYALIKNFYWNSELIIGYVANDEINNSNNGIKDKTSIIEFARNEFYCYYQSN